MAVEELAITAGPISIAAARVLASFTAIYGFLTGVQAYHAMRVKLEDRWSAVAATAVMFALAGLLWTDGATLFPAPFSVITIVVLVGAIVFTVTYTLGQYKEKIEKFRGEAGDRMQNLLKDVLPGERFAEWERLRARFQLTHEERRKAPHLMMGLFFLLYLVVGGALLRGVWKTLYGGVGGTGESILNLYTLSHSHWLIGGHVFAVMVLLWVLYILVPTELLRLRFPELSYPFKDTITTRLRPREAGLFGAHYYIAAAAPAAALWMTRDPTQWMYTIPAVLAILGATVFADAASALIGVKYGRRKWPHYRNKSYAGTVGGMLVAVAIGVPFVGWTMGAVVGLTFALVDIIGPKPIPISDNILNPVFLTAALLLGSAYLDPLIPWY